MTKACTRARLRPKLLYETTRLSSVKKADCLTQSTYTNKDWAGKENEVGRFSCYGPEASREGDQEIFYSRPHKACRSSQHQPNRRDIHYALLHRRHPLPQRVRYSSPSKRRCRSSLRKKISKPNTTTTVYSICIPQQSEQPEKFLKRTLERSLAFCAAATGIAPALYTSVRSRSESRVSNKELRRAHFEHLLR